MASLEPGGTLTQAVKQPYAIDWTCVQKSTMGQCEQDEDDFKKHE